MVELKSLLEMNAFKDLDDAALIEVAEHAEMNEFKNGDRLIAEQYSGYSLYLFEGAVDLQTSGGVNQIVNASMERAQEPIFYSNAMGHYCRCTATVKILQVEQDSIDKYGITINREQDALNYDEFETLPAVDSSLAFVNEVTQLFKSKVVTLPSLPEIALYINAAIDKDDISTKKLSKIVQMDPVIAARVVQVANSAMYGGVISKSIQDAIARIGIVGLRTIVMGVVLRDLFMPTTELITKYMAQFYEHSIRVGVMCYELAKKLKGFNPEHAFLSGILHDIGIVPILVVADKHTELAYKASNLDDVLVQLKSYVGSIILKQWDFSPEYIEIAKQAYNWDRQVDKADYCDLVQVALLYSEHIGGQKISSPALQKLPAYSRLGLDNYNPVEDIEIFKSISVRVKELIKMICR